MEINNLESVSDSDLMQTYSNECSKLGHAVVRISDLDNKIISLSSDRYNLCVEKCASEKLCAKLFDEINSRGR